MLGEDLADLIDHHHVIHGEEVFRGLYRPDPRALALRAAARSLQVLRSRSVPQPPGFEAVTHWQGLKRVRLMQLHFAPGPPTINRNEVLPNYEQHVPDFPLKEFGSKLWQRDLAARYPADRKDVSPAHARKCVRYVEEAADLLRQHRQPAP